MKPLVAILFVIFLISIQGMAWAASWYSQGFYTIDGHDIHRSALHIEQRRSYEGYVLIIHPGGNVDPETIQVSIQGRLIVVDNSRSMHSENKNDSGYYSFSRSFSNFRNHYVIPHDVDMQRIRREVKDGKIIITLPFLRRPFIWQPFG